MAFDLALEFILSGKPKRVMQLLTDPVLIRKWSGDEAILENKAGGRFEMFDGWVMGSVLKTSENELAYTWLAGDWPEGTKPSEVHYLRGGYESDFAPYRLPESERNGQPQNGLDRFLF
jgi:uncharacterized protein YndB with AHSA1/START domain